MNYDDLHKIVVEANTYHDDEVGITHPKNRSFIKIANNGDIEVFAGEGIGFILHPANKSITFVADSVNFIVKNKGVRINDAAINDRAFKFTEPTLVPHKHVKRASLYEYTDSFLDDEYDYSGDDKILDNKTKKWVTREEYKDLYGSYPTWDGSKYV